MEISEVNLGETVLELLNMAIIKQRWYENANTWAIIAGAFSCVLSIIAISRTCDYSYNMDYIGVIAGLLAFLVSILMAWNLSQILEYKKTKEKSLANYYSSKSMIFSIKGESHLYHNQNRYAIDKFISAIKYAKKGNDLDPILIACNGLKTAINGLKIDKELKREIIYILKDLDVPIADDIRNIIK